MSHSNRSEESIFESEVRRLARELFPKAKVTGPVFVAGRERDGVYADGDSIHVVEATVSKWPAPGSEDTKLRCLLELEVDHGATEIYSGVQA